jgi:hypothetical protein
MRQSRHFGITLKEAPREAHAAAHRLLLRAGYLRSLAAGIPVVMPYLLRVLNRLAGMLQAELNARQFEELARPLLQPAALWQAPEPAGKGSSLEEAVFAFKDRRGAVLGLGAEPGAMLAAVASREIRSYQSMQASFEAVCRQVELSGRWVEDGIAAEGVCARHAFVAPAESGDETMPACDGRPASHPSMSTSSVSTWRMKACTTRRRRFTGA